MEKCRSADPLSTHKSLATFDSQIVGQVRLTYRAGELERVAAGLALAGAAVLGVSFAISERSPPRARRGLGRGFVATAAAPR